MERCKYELIVEKYFGLPDKGITENTQIKVDYGVLVDLVCAADQEFNKTKEAQEGGVQQPKKKIEDYLHLEVEWRDIPLYPRYQASNLGNIRNEKKVLSKHISKGYYQVGLWVNGKVKNIKVSILTAMGWHPNPLNKKTVNHKDTNKLNDCQWNLEWATQQENVIHAIANNCRKSFKLSHTTIDKIVAKSKKRITVTDTTTNKAVTVSSVNNCALMLQVSQSAISKALKYNSLISKQYKVNYATK